jgi:hypothetical protein
MIEEVKKQSAQAPYTLDELMEDLKAHQSTTHDLTRGFMRDVVIIAPKTIF